MTLDEYNYKVNRTFLDIDVLFYQILFKCLPIFKQVKIMKTNYILKNQDY